MDHGNVWASAAALAVPATVALAIPLSLAVDLAFGEPPARMHPVVWMGRYLQRAGRGMPDLPPALAFAGGAAAWLFGAALVLVPAVALQWWALQSLPAWLAVPALALLLKPLLAWRMLRDEVAAVEQALAQSLQDGRARLSRLVSRDTAALDAVDVREAALESLAENLNDSVVAPLMWFALAGLPGAALYRFANTADAMWGYRGRWEWAGKWAARADDLLSWLPARITALMLCAAARRWPGRSLLAAQAGRTPSPNGGWPMGALALLLGCRLGKPGVYALNPQGAAAQPLHAARALALAGRGVAAWVVLATALSVALHAALHAVLLPLGQLA